MKPAIPHMVQTRGSDAVGPIVHRFQEEVLEGFWPERIQYVHDRYATLPFPFDEIAVPPFVMSAEWTLGGVTGWVACAVHKIKMT